MHGAWQNPNGARHNRGEVAGASLHACRLDARNFRVGRLSPSAMAGLEERSSSTEFGLQVQYSQCALRSRERTKGIQFCAELLELFGGSEACAAGGLAVFN